VKSVIFDLDGTLADTSADMIAAANAAFQELGYGAPLDPVGDARVAFRGGRAMLQEGYFKLGLVPPEDELQDGHRKLLAYYDANILLETRLYPGVRAAVEALRANGYALGICTNKPQGLAEKLMVALDFRAPFSALVGGDTLAVRKPHVAPYAEVVSRIGGAIERSVLIGDTETDYATARAAKVPIVLITFGPDGRQAVSNMLPDALMDHYDDLSGIVTRLIG
jgi:phosphoglycolate phosphatase